MKKRLLSIIMVLALCLGLMPTVALAADGDVQYLYCNENGVNWQTGTKKAGEYTEITADNPPTTWGETGKTTWYVVNRNSAVTIGTAENPQRVIVSGDVRLILADGCKLTVNGGIQVEDNSDAASNKPNTNALTIYGQSTDETTMGTLIAQDTQHHSNAAIGGNSYGVKGGAGGTVTINGGTVTATSAWGTGIGGGYGEGWGGSGGTVTINGGFVEATSNNGAGIGGGYGINCGSGGIVIINGGTVKAESHLSAGIGGGGGGQNGGDGGKITINGGTVTATGTYYGAGIGGGGGKNGGSGGTVIINDGIVKAKSAYGVGIGGGGGTGAKGGSGGTITINGGIVEAASAKGAGIGGGSYDSYDSVYTRGDGAIVTITGGTVKAESSTFKANEGDFAPNYSYGIYAKNMTISGNAEVTAIGGEASTSYGIYVAYTSDNANSGSMTISGNAEVTAIGGEAAYSVGINAKNLTVNSGSVKAKGSDINYSNVSGAARSYGIEANMTVNGGTVEAEGGDLTISDIEAVSGSFGIQGFVNINGGSVTATGGSINGTGYSVSSYGISGSVTITGGHVTAQALDSETANASRYALGSAPKALPSAYWWRTAANNAFTTSSTTAYAYKDSDTYVEITDHFTVTLDPNYEGSTSSTVITGADGKLTSLPTPTRDGYTFAGWFTDATNGTKVTNETEFSKNTTIYAHWTAETTVETYTVKLNTNGGTINSGNVTAYTCGQVTALPTDVTRAGYTFAGWYDNAAFTGNPVTEIGADETGEKAYWAKWVYTTVPDEIPFVPQAPQNGWKELTAGSVYYKNGVKVKGLQEIDGETYYFDEKGYLQTGWVELDGDWYYFDAAMQTGWLKQGNTWYYLDPRNGAMAEGGMQEIDGATYYFYDWGGMASNFWYLDEKGDWYYFGGDGAMAESKWVLWNGAWYYLGSDGEMLAEKWLYWNGEWYYLGSDGAMLTNTTTPDGYYVNNEGVWVK